MQLAYFESVIKEKSTHQLHKFNDFSIRLAPAR